MVTRKYILPLFLIIVFGLCGFSPNEPAKKPFTENPYPECPFNTDTIWMRMNSHGFGKEVVQIPFETGEVVIEGETYVNYILGVLLTEVGPANDFLEVDDETIKMMAVLARTVAYRNCGCELIGDNDDCHRSTFNDKQGISHRGMNDDTKQQYAPRKAQEFTPEEIARYQQAIDDTSGVYLTYEGNIFDVQYRDISGLLTLDYDENGE